MALRMVLICAAATAVFLLAYYCCGRDQRRKGSLHPLPPGPRGLPLVGNILDLPPRGQAEYPHWLKLKCRFGPVSYISVLGQPVVVIQDQVAANFIMEKNGLKSAGRPLLPFAYKSGHETLLPFQQYNKEYKNQRKHIHQYLGTMKSAAGFNSVQDIESRRALLRILNDPTNLRDHLKRQSGTIILNVTYGYSPSLDVHDPLVTLADKFMVNLAQVLVPFIWLLDSIPQIGHLPEGFPLTASHRKTARSWSRLTRAVRDTPYDFFQQQRAAGTDRPSYVSHVFEKLRGGSTDGLTNDDENVAKNSAAIIYAAGAHTTPCAIFTCILGILLNPSVQRRAQEEIDSVVGPSRLPGMEDRDKLPYINALVKETLRWYPVAPINTPHRADDEIIYNGYRIPRGAYLYVNTFACLHDPKVYPQPEVFDPERFLEPRNEPDPEAHVFGYGRRACPGRYFAMSTLFITISRLLATFSITKPRDDEGREVEVLFEPMPGLVSCPTPHPYAIEPRSSQHAELIREVERLHPWEPSDAARLHLDPGLLT